MTASTAVDLATEVADAHASATLAAADHIAVSVSSGGLAFPCSSTSAWWQQFR